MEFKNSQSLMMEQEKRSVSIARRDNLYLTDTESQIRRLCSQGTSTDERLSDSKTTNENMMKMTKFEVDALHNKIESEIGKLRSFRRSFLKDERYTTKTRLRTLQMQPHVRTQTRAVDSEKTTGKSSELRRNLRTLSSEDFLVTPYFRTICVMPSPRRSGGSDWHCEPVSRRDADRGYGGCDGRGGKQIVEDSSKQPLPRICGGCIYGCYDKFHIPCTIYQNGYCQCICPPMMEYGSCCMPCSSNFCYQPMELFMPSTCRMSNCSPTLPFGFKRKTDLNTEESCQRRLADLASERQDSITGGTQFGERTRSGPSKEAPQGRGPARQRAKKATKNANRRNENIMKISYRKQPAQVLNGNNNSLKRYGVISDRTNDGTEASSPNVDMHRHYMKMYTTVQKTSDSRDSSQTAIAPDDYPSYTAMREQNTSKTNAEPGSAYLINTATSATQRTMDLPVDVHDETTEWSEEQRRNAEAARSDRLLDACALTVPGPQTESDPKLESESEPERILCPVGQSKKTPTTDMAFTCQHEPATCSQFTSHQCPETTTSCKSRHQEAQTITSYACNQYLDSKPECTGTVPKPDMNWEAICASIIDTPDRENKRVDCGGSQSARQAYDTTRSNIPWQNLITNCIPPTRLQSSYSGVLCDLDDCSQKGAVTPSSSQPGFASWDRTEHNMDGGHNTDTTMQSDAYRVPVGTDQTEAIFSNLCQPFASQSPCEGFCETLMSKKPRRSVTFEDESGPCCSSCCGETQQPASSRRHDTNAKRTRFAHDSCHEKDHYSDTEEQVYSYRSCSTTNTEYTCDGDYSTSAESRNISISKNIPPYTGCLCMLDEYIQLASRCKQKSKFPNSRPIE